MLLSDLSVLRTLISILNKSEGGGGGGGPKGEGGGFAGKKLLLSPLLENSVSSLSLFSLD